MRGTTTNTSDSALLRSALWLAAWFAAAKLLLHFALTLWTTHLGYRYFRDEFYYIACGHHLAWGYVDHGPVVALQARLGEMLFGSSVFALRILSAAAGSAAVFLTGTLAWVLGGRRPAQALAMLGLVCCPQYIGTDGYLSMNSFEPLFWMSCVLALLLLVREGSRPLWWSAFGVAAGVGLLNKPSMAFFLASVAAGLLLTPQRRVLRSRWAALGISLMLLIALPNLLWQVHHHWPTVEFLQNGRRGNKNMVLNPFRFFLAQVANMQPVNALLWIPGTVALLRGRAIKGVRWLGIAAAVFFAGMTALHAKDYYLAAVYPALFAAGAAAWEHRFARARRVAEGRLFAFPALEAVLVITSIVILPMSSPVLRPETWVRYTAALHLHRSATETAASGPLPQFYADRFGWQEEVDLVRKTFLALSPADRRRVCIFTNNYGEAGAIDFLGQSRATGTADVLPPALSGHNNYWLWGTHGCDPDVVIAVVHDTPEELLRKYTSVQTAGRLTNAWAMPFEHKSVYLLRGRRAIAPFRWEDERFYF